MNKIIDRELLNWALSIEDIDEIYAQNYGSFSLERMDFHIFMSDEESKKFDIAEKIMLENDGIPPSDEIAHDYYKPIQSYNHELVHYYQALCLPAFNIYQQLTKKFIEFEAATMLRYFEYGHSYTIMKDKKILDALEKPEFIIPESEQKNLNNLISKYKFYKEQWTSKYKNISLFYIIEGMAHVMSIQLTPNSNNYLCQTENKIEYNIAYDVYIASIEKKYEDIDTRIKHLVFLYICYFSCQIISLINDDVLEKTPRLFYTLLSRVNLYFKAYSELAIRYTRYSLDELKQLNQFQINQKDINICNENQLCNIYALFELIPMIEQDAKKFYNSNEKKLLDVPNEYFEVLKKELNIDLMSIYQLANFALFPVRIADMWEAYDKIQELKVDDNKFSNNDESAFYEFILSCKKLLMNKAFLVPCCEEHKNKNSIHEILYCKNEGSFAYHLKELTQREPADLFRILEVG